MQALLSYDRSPPIAAPFRFFLTAPFFGVAAGVLLVVSGQNVFLSRWTPEALALTLPAWQAQQHPKPVKGQPEEEPADYSPAGPYLDYLRGEEPDPRD